MNNTQAAVVTDYPQDVDERHHLWLSTLLYNIIVNKLFRAKVVTHFYLLMSGQARIGTKLALQNPSHKITPTFLLT